MKQRSKDILLIVLCILPLILLSPNAFANQKGTLRVGFIRKPTSLDPHFENYPINQAFNWHLFDTLTGFDSQYRIQPVLAESWKIYNPCTWVFNLRKGISFHNGMEFSAQDVIFSFERIRDIKRGSDFPRILRSYRIEATDKYNIRITTPVPNPGLLFELAGIAIVSKEAAKFAPEDFDSGKAAVGTGPYMFVKWEGKDSLLLARNEKYWREKLPWSWIKLRFISKSKNQADDLAAGDLDIAMGINPKQLKDMQKDESIDIISGPRNRVRFLFLNGEKNSILKDYRVRTAIARAIDRQAILRIQDITNAVPTSQFVPEGRSGFNPRFPGNPYDPEMAKKLLAEAGYPDGFELNLYASYRDRKASEVIALMLNRIRIRTNLYELEFQPFHSKSRKGLLSAGLLGYRGGPEFALSALRDIYHSHESKPGFGMRNYGRYADPDMDKLIGNAMRSFDMELRSYRTKQAMDWVGEKYPVVPLYNYGNEYAVRKDYELRSDAEKYILYVSLGESAGDMLKVPTTLLPPPPGEPKELVWNTWTEDEERGPFKPIQTLKPNTRYRIAIDLSAFEYLAEGVQWTEAGEKLVDEIEKYLNSKDHIVIRAVQLPDLTYFKNPSREHAVKDIRIDLNKIRKIIREGHVQYADDIMAYLREKSKDPAFDPKFLFGRTDFEIETRGREGWGSIAIVLFKNNRPIDEITKSFCIGNCEGTRQMITSTTRGFDSMRVATEEAPFPDASMYFIELQRGILTGLFISNDPDGRDANGDYYNWNTEYNQEGFKDYLTNTLIPEIGIARDESILQQIGEDMFGFLFPQQDPAGRMAYNAFQSFVRKSSSRVSSDSRKPSIFARVVTFGNEPPLLLHLGLMFTEISSEEEDFLGRHFRLETPLPEQSYRIHERAPARWVMLMPPENTEPSLERAREAMGDTLDRWESGPGFITFQDMDTFRAWIKDSNELPDAPTALIVLSHQHRNKIYFRKRESLISAAVKRQFESPSFAVLNGCGTGEPRAIDFIRRLNKLGIETIIATSSSVDATMAGKFYHCMDKILQENRSNKDFTVSDMYYDSIVGCLWKEKYRSVRGMREYGPNALKYILLGNSNVKLLYP